MRRRRTIAIFKEALLFARSRGVEIARKRGISRAEAARQAIAETAERDARRRGLAAEATALASNPAYVSEAREVAELMEQLRGPQ